jgi:hypothetical protein
MTLTLPSDPILDDPVFEQGWGLKPVTLRVLIAHAFEVQRSDPAHYPDLFKFPTVQEYARDLWNAHRRRVPPLDLMPLATEFNAVLRAMRASKSAPKGGKPPVGKATDRLGEKARQTAEKAAQKQARQELRAPATLLPDAPADSLWGRVL